MEIRIKQLKFKNHFVSCLPGDEQKNGYPRQVHDACYSFVDPTKTSDPSLVCVSQDVANVLNISSDNQQSSDFLNIFSGNQIASGSKPYAMCYGGHQFGHWAGQLGDGRAINLGELSDRFGNNQTLQLKGAGLTPYSRTADGLAVLRSSVREFLCSEAMHYLGVPTTRALSLILTGDDVMRDMFYDGNAQLEKGAIVCRVSPSFLRFGSFQIHASRNETETLTKLMNYSINNNFPHLGSPCVEVYEKWFDEICQSTAKLIIHWMRVGFVHGVMNTDNMSILGETIDYGPYGWLEGYDPEWTPNTTDAQGKRYCFGNQPQIAQWNLFQLANAIAPVVGRVDALEASLASFSDTYSELSKSMYANKLGLDEHNGEEDQKLIEELFKVLQLADVDMTIFFRCLAKINHLESYADYDFIQIIKPAYYQVKEIEDIDNKNRKRMVNWLREYLTRIGGQKLEDTDRVKKMNKTNPKFVLRNYLAQVAIDKANEGDFSEIEKLLEIMKEPYDEQPEYQAYAEKRPEWAKNKAGCSMLSCSS